MKTSLHHSRLRAAVLFPVLLLLASMAFSQHKNFMGTWVSFESSVKYEISQSNGQLEVTSLDQSDGEELKVTEVKVISSKVISFHLYTPSTNWNVDIQFTLQGKGTIEEEVNGDGQAVYHYYKKGSKDYQKANSQTEG